MADGDLVIFNTLPILPEIPLGALIAIPSFIPRRAFQFAGSAANPIPRRYTCSAIARFTTFLYSISAGVSCAIGSIFIFG